MPKVPSNHPLQKLRTQPQSSPVAMANAAKWNAGGYDQFKQGDPAREAAKQKLDAAPAEPMTEASPLKRLKLTTSGQQGN